MLLLECALAGLGVGFVFGLFGAGGSAFATPVLALIGVSGFAAVASPLPAMIPAAFAGARRYLRSGNLDRKVALLAIAGGLPGVLVGAGLSQLLGGNRLLLLSGLMLLAVGVRLLLPDRRDRMIVAARRDNTALVVGSTFAVGLATGMLANGGGFLLVPLFLLVLGMTAAEAAGTSMLVVAVLTLPTLGAHWVLGHIEWSVAAAFAVGLVPASLVGANFAQRVSSRRARNAFAWLLILFSIAFLARRVL